jgi:tetratricopeptide (TPR) repeat protein
MTWWHRLTGGTSGRGSRPTDFLAEALELEARGDFPNALTSYRLALRERPDDLRVLQNIAIAFSKTGQPEEAIRTYRRALQIDPDLAGAHYGLAFLLLKRSDTAHAGMHLEAYLRSSTGTDEATQRFRAHAQRTLDRLRGEAESTAPSDASAEGHAHVDGHHDQAARDSASAREPHGGTADRGTMHDLED